MENEMTPKQALEELRKECNAQCFDKNGKHWWITDKKADYRCNIIEQALDELEELKMMKASFENDVNRLNEQCTNLHLKDKKQTEILEVLKKEPYLSLTWYRDGTYQEYCEEILEIKLTETEFNLIKEWLK